MEYDLPAPPPHGSIMALDDALSDDVLAHALSFADFKTAVRFGSTVSKRLRDRVSSPVPRRTTKDAVRRTNSGDAAKSTTKPAASGRGVEPSSSAAAFAKLWYDIYRRHGFAPPDDGDDGNANGYDGRRILAETVARRALFDNLTGESALRRKKKKQNEALLLLAARNDHSDGTKKKEKKKKQKATATARARNARPPSCLSLPNRYCHFVPLTPNLSSFPSIGVGNGNGNGDDELLQGGDNGGDGEGGAWLDEFDDFDPPPVDFAADSFALLPGTSPQLVLMDPFDGTVAVYDDVLGMGPGGGGGGGAVRRSDYEAEVEEMLEGAPWRGAAADASNNNGVSGNGAGIVDDDDAEEEDREEERIDGAVRRHVEHGLRRGIAAPARPSQVLFGVEDYFLTDLSDYFDPPGANDGAAATTSAGNDGGGVAGVPMRDGDEVTVDWLGIDLHAVVLDASSSGNRSGRIGGGEEIGGSMVGAARILTAESANDVDEAGAGAARSCTEVLGWKATTTTGGRRYDTKHVCRLSGFPNYLDLDAVHDKVYATFARGEGPRIPVGDGEEEDATMLRRRRHRHRQEDGAENDGEDDEDAMSLSDVGWNGMSVRSSCSIVRYPLVCTSAKGGEGTLPSKRELFPQPESFVRCQRPVSSFTVDPTGGTLVVGTDGGCVEVWSTGLLHRRRGGCGGASVLEGSSGQMRRIQILDLPRELELAKERREGSKRKGWVRKQRVGPAEAAAFPAAVEEIMEHGEGGEDIFYGDGKEEEEGTMDESSDVPDVLSDMEVDTDVGGRGNGSAAASSSLPTMTQCSPTRRVDSIHLPRHLPVDRCGFVTLQHHRSEGATLSLWQKPSMSHDGNCTGEPFELSAVINLPIASQRKPQVHYDGKRLVVFGQDHIGLIVLVYHVLSTWEDRDAFLSDDAVPNDYLSQHQSSSDGVEDSGGVINLSPSSAHPRRVRYANRIRHAGLGGIDFHDPVFMTCNERFVVLNTKTGNLVGVGDEEVTPGACEGLFVIDLRERS